MGEGELSSLPLFKSGHHPSASTTNHVCVCFIDYAPTRPVLRRRMLHQEIQPTQLLELLAVFIKQ